MKPISIVFFAAVAQAGAIWPRARGDIMDECDDIVLSTEIQSKHQGLYAKCGENEEGIWLDLEKCISNDNGMLLWQKE